MTKDTKYLITAPDEGGARRIAKAKKLAPYEWLYIPLDPATRKCVLAGKTGFPRNHLIGSFTPEEIKVLTRQVPEALHA
ncbi:hypothetical protein [Tumebacillus flagellatus]|nr:hypothetical protein [Tumebacillus flagellatus]